MRRCFVPLCDAKNKDRPNRPMFSVPKDSSLFAQWVANLPNVKQLRHHDKVCCLHFKPEDVEYTFDHIINGQIFEIQRDRPKLKPNAVPCLEMTTKAELLSYRVKSREPKIAKINDQSYNLQVYELITETQKLENVKVKIVNKNGIQESEVDNSTFTIEDTNEIHDFLRNKEQTESTIEDNCQIDLVVKENTDVCNDNNATERDLEEKLNVFNSLYDNIHTVLMPNSLWGLHRCPNRTALCFSYMDLAEMKITKIISITANGSVQLFANTFLINTLQLVKDIDNDDKLSILLNQVDLWRFCYGQSTNENCEIVVEPNDENCWNTDEMEEVFFCKVCTQTG